MAVFITVLSLDMFTPLTTDTDDAVGNVMVATIFELFKVGFCVMCIVAVAVADVCVFGMVDNDVVDDELKEELELELLVEVELFKVEAFFNVAWLLLLPLPLLILFAVIFLVVRNVFSLLDSEE